MAVGWVPGGKFSEEITTREVPTYLLTSYMQRTERGRLGLALHDAYVHDVR